MNDSDNNDLQTFSDGPPMPAMCEALLCEDDVNRLFDDLEACVAVLSVQEKGGEQAYAGQSPGVLSKAKPRLLNGSVRALQIRYAYQDREWTDTLMCLPTGIRLVRCQHPETQDIRPTASTQVWGDHREPRMDANSRE